MAAGGEIEIDRLAWLKRRQAVRLKRCEMGEKLLRRNTAESSGIVIPNCTACCHVLNILKKKEGTCPGKGEGQDGWAMKGESPQNGGIEPDKNNAA